MNQDYVFADVDGTLWNDRSVVSFYRHFLSVRAGGPDEPAWENFLADVQVQERQGATREELNAWFYQSRFCGVAVREIEAAAASWWHAQRRRPGFWHANMLARLREHQRRGHIVVLVTGAFRELIEPLRLLIDTRHVLAAPLIEEGGRYTGALRGGPMIGAGKERAVRAFAETHGIDPRHTHGYGDDESDIPFLARLAHPCAVAAPGSPMASAAAARGWAVLEPVPADEEAVRAELAWQQ